MNYKNPLSRLEPVAWALAIFILHYVFINQVLLDRIVERSKYAFSYVKASKRVDIHFPWKKVDRLTLHAFSPHHRNVQLVFVGDGKVVDTIVLRGGSWTLWEKLEVEFPGGVQRVRIVAPDLRPFPWALAGLGFRRVDGSESFTDAMNRYKEARIYGTGYVELYGSGKFNRFAWDGPWYRAIFRHGYAYDGNPYRKQNTQFPPLYPIVSKIISKLIKKGEYTLVITSTLFAVLTFIILALFTAHHFGREISYKTVLLMAAYPSSIHFYMAYSESLNMFILLLSVYLLLTRRYFPAFLTLGVATAVRFQSAFFLPAFLLVYLIEAWDRMEDMKFVILRIPVYAILGISGIIVFSLYLWHEFSDPLVWYKLNRYAWGNVHHFSSPFEVIWKNITTTIPQNMGTVLMTPKGDHVLFMFLMASSLILYAIRRRVDHIFILSAIPFVLLIIALLSQKVPFYESMTRHIHNIPTLFILISLLFSWRIISLFVALFSVLLVLHALSVDAFVMVHLPIILDTFVP